ncbi:YihY/virulence factor BrkB family protein [Piscinibacter sakaiensis]|uniref:YihY/virulence factor BrkB family protein n=1 Tax=Piscinibacter sakaiensis TaxID=1547922 RepID=UPI00372CD0E4
MPTLITPRQAWSLCRATVDAWLDDRAASMGAALAYYTLFSIAPLLLIVISVAGLLFGAEAARGEIFEQARGLVGDQGAAALQALLESVNRPAGGVAATLLGIGLMVIGATTVFAELQGSLDRIWQVPPRLGSGVWDLLRARVLSFGVILGIGFLLIVSLLFSAAIAALQKWWSPWLGSWQAPVEALNHVLSLLLVTTMFAMIYRLMPRVRIEWRDVAVGAVVTATLFTLGKWAIGLYIGTTGVGSGFGAAGSLVALMAWVYYSAQVFLLGAEFTWVYAHTLGSRRGMPADLPPTAAPLRPAGAGA